MPFIETEASVRYETINGKRVPVITPKTEVTLTTADPAASSTTKRDLTIALELDGTVYSVVTSVVVKLTLSFLYIFAIILILTK